MIKKKFVSQRSYGVRDSCGIGNVIIHKDVDREKYIQRCYFTNKVSMLLENGGIVDDIYVEKSVLKNIDFPLDYNKLGSQVIWINKPRLNRPIIIGILSKSNEPSDIDQDSNSLRQSSTDGVSEFIVDSKKGIVIINSASTKETGGDIYILSTNKNKSSKVKVKVSGSLDIETPLVNVSSSKKITLTIQDPDIDDKVTTIVYEKSIGLTYKDEFGNEITINNDNIQLKPISKLNIGTGKEPIPLGQTLQQQITAEQAALTTLMTAIQSAPVVPGDGGAAFKASIVAAISSVQRGDYSSILSKVSNTD